MDLSTDQENVLDAIESWWHKGATSTLTVGGYAGTGKTTLISMLRDYLPTKLFISFCAFTGKAAYVLRSKLEATKTLRSCDTCSTIHGLIYRPILSEDKKKILGWKRVDELHCDLIVIDEASMVGSFLYEDLKSFGIPILAIGDHGQLPPVGDNINLMEFPDLKLEKIHRQKEGDPIIKLSLMAREEGYIPYGIHGSSVAKVHKKHSTVTEFINHSGRFQDTVILCGFNKTRVAINKKIRLHFGYSGDFPEEQERVICLKNNREAKNCPIYNGVLGTVLICEKFKDHLELNVKIDGEEREYFGPGCPDTFSNSNPELIWKKIKRIDIDPNSNAPLTMVEQSIDFFDFGYCLSVHKSQGSEWGRVMVVEQPCRYWSGKDWNRWLYTAVTRSSKQLLIVR